jgi:hypothetical protein
LFLTSFLFIRDKYQEFFVYGERTTAFLEDVSVYTSTGDNGGGGITYFTYHLRVPSFNNAIMEDNRNYQRKKVERLNLNNLNIGDTIEIKVLSKIEAKMLSHKGMKINEYNSFWENFWRFFYNCCYVGNCNLPLLFINI